MALQQEAVLKQFLLEMLESREILLIGGNQKEVFCFPLSGLRKHYSSLTLMKCRHFDLVLVATST